MKKKKELVEVEPVKLPEMMGMRPGKYILISLVVIVLLLIFLILFLPGIVKGGRWTSFSSDLSEVGVIVDGRYVGSSEGSRYFIPSGSHDIEYIKNGITMAEETIEVDHPVFGTLFAHRNLDVEIPQPEVDLYPSVYESVLRDLVSYSGILEYDEFYNYRPIYENYARDVVALSVDDVSQDLHTLSLFVTNMTMLEDLRTAIALLEENGVTFSAVDTSKIESLISGSYSSEDLSSSLDSTSTETSDGFHHYGGGLVTMGIAEGGMETLPLQVEVAPFELSHSLVSEYDWAVFVQENPYWSKDNIETLVADGMVDEYYLAGINLTTRYEVRTPIRNISWNAANAYCQWLSEKTGEEYRMPSEAEWYIASLDAQERSYSTSLATPDSDPSSPANVMGCLWEFTSSAYLPLSRLEGLTFSAGEIPQTDIIVKGGSYINSPSSVSRESVGVMERSVTSDYAGFRLVREVL